MHNADAWCIDKPSARVVLNVLADLRLARNLGGLGNFVLGAGSKLNCLLHTAARPIGKRWSPERPPRVGDRWTCSSSETRMGRAWVVDRIDLFISAKGTRDTPTTIVVFRDPDDAEHTCHVGESQFKCDGWAPVPVETLRHMVEVLDFMRTGPADLTGRLERTCRRHVPPVIGEDHKTYEARAAEALVAAGWSIGHSVADAEAMLVKPLKAYAQPALDVAEGEYWEAPAEVVSCRVDAYMRGESGPFARFLRADPQIGEAWVAPDGRVWRITGHHGPDLVAETRHDGRVTKAILVSRLFSEWRRATPEETGRMCDARDWIVVDKTPGPR